MKQPIIYIVSNEKGGIGKTFTTMLLSYLATTPPHKKAPNRKLKKVLAVDADFQANLTFALTKKERETFENNSLIQAISEQDARPYIVKINDNLDLLPASKKLAEFDSLFTAVKDKIPEPHKLIQRVIQTVASDYDVIIIDTAPSLSSLKTLLFNIEYAQVILPMQTERFGLTSVLNFANTLENIRNQSNPTLTIKGIVPILTDARMTSDLQIIDEASELLGDSLMNVVVKRKAKLKKIVDEGFSEHYAEERHSLEDYYKLFDLLF